MWIKDTKYFEQLVDNCCNGSIYDAINHVATQARKHMKECREDNKYVLDSKALTWAVTGEKPTLLDNDSIIHNRYIEKIDYMYDMFCCIEDKEICSAVEDSYYSSLKLNHLIYVYNSILDEPRKARVRVLTRMVWDYN